MKTTPLRRLIFSLTPILPCFIGFGVTDSALAHTSRNEARGDWIAQVAPIESDCPPPALARLSRHVVAPGETIDTIAQQYSLISATLLGFNPALREGQPVVGTELTIPPFNGIRVEVPPGTTWRDLAEQYRVRADALFEVNGCQDTPPSTAFIPGVNWSPTPGTPSAASVANPLSGYPLPAVAEVLTTYGWQIDPGTEQYVFQSGVTLQAEPNTVVLSVGAGTVAFAGQQPAYGNLVVINHSDGLQTRYARLNNIAVQAGQQLAAGDRIGTVAATDSGPTFLWFEVRSNSSLGWVAQDPGAYIPDIRAVDPVRRREASE